MLVVVGFNRLARGVEFVLGLRKKLLSFDETTLIKFQMRVAGKRLDGYGFLYGGFMKPAHDEKIESHKNTTWNSGS